ncbi:MAG TPA: DinB family protein [Alloacidobacterium sp.]|nr:DinB family protein [Alloacidobacterium sp.]
MLNPYAKFIGDQSLQEILSTTAAKLAEFYKQLGPAGLEKSPAPGKWNAREIFAHLADCEIAFAFRLRQALAEDDHVIQPFDQEKWASAYAAYDASAAIAAFSALRRWNLALIGSLTSREHAKTVTHPERGTMTFATIVETMAGHDLNHLQQLDGIAHKA